MTKERKWERETGTNLWQREAEENGLQTEPELQNAVQSPKQIRKTCRREVRRVCNVLGWALAFFSVMTVLVSILLEVAGNVWVDGGVISTFLNRMVNAAWYEDGGSTLVIYALVLPFVFLILRLVPEERAEKMKISFLQFCMFFILAQGFGTIFNLLGNAINDAVAASSGGDASAMNPVNEMLDSLSPVMILYVGFLGPIIEEYIFRWKLLNRLRRFGDKAAITYTALMFGLMHGNVTQFLYAAVIGVVLGYVAVKTGRMRYNCLLHILINSWSLVIAMLGTQDTLLPLFITFLMTGFMGCTIIGAFVLLIFNFRKIRLSDGAIPEGVKFRNICGAMYGNLGTVAFILVSLITMAFFLLR